MEAWVEVAAGTDPDWRAEGMPVKRVVYFHGPGDRPGYPGNRRVGFRPFLGLATDLSVFRFCVTVTVEYLR
jgi:hypothetical protein